MSNVAAYLSAMEAPPVKCGEWVSTIFMGSVWGTGGIPTIGEPTRQGKKTYWENDEETEQLGLERYARQM
jgi:hypothetical protein